jgi:hypothetical protein
MQFQATAAEIKQAQVPHNLFVSGLFLFDLLMTPAVIVLNLGMVGLLIPLFFSAALISYIFMRSRKKTAWFVDAHWRLSFKHGQWLMLGYAISALLVFVAWLISLTAHDANMGHILWTALTRVALMPTLIAVMVTAVVEGGAIGLASKREVPDKIASVYPPVE